MSIGEALAHARREAGLTVAHVSAATRIRETIVRGIERDEFEPCGGHFYARGHIRSIARTLGIDAEPLVAQYDEEHGGSPRAMSPQQGVDPMPVSGAGRRRRPNLSVAIAALLVAVIAFGIFRFVGGSDTQAQSGGPAAGGPTSSAPPTDLAAQPPKGQATLPPTGRASGTPGPTRPEPSESATPEGAAVRLDAEEPTWVSATGSKGQQFFRGVLQPGDSKQFTDDELIRLHIGNLGGVSLTINGKNYGVVGESGAVNNGLQVYPDRVAGLS